MDITFTDGGQGTATVEEGRGALVLTLRRGFPVAAETVGATYLQHVTRPVLAALGVAEGDRLPVADMVGDWRAETGE